MKSNCFKAPKKAFALPDYMSPVSSEDGKEREKIMPEKGDILEFRVKGIVTDIVGEDAVIEIRHVNDERVEAPESDADREAGEEKKLRRAAEEADGYDDSEGE